MSVRHAVAFVAAVLLGTACVSVESVRDARGQGVKRTFRQPYDAVYAAAADAAVKRRFEVIEQDRAAGRILLAADASWTSAGERVAIFVTRAGARATQVEIVAKPVLPLVTFPPDWPALLFADIENALALARAVR